MMWRGEMPLFRISTISPGLAQSKQILGRVAIKSRITSLGLHFIASVVTLSSKGVRHTIIGLDDFERVVPVLVLIVECGTVNKEESSVDFVLGGVLLGDVEDGCVVINDYNLWVALHKFVESRLLHNIVINDASDCAELLIFLLVAHIGAAGTGD